MPAQPAKLSSKAVIVSALATLIMALSLLNLSIYITNKQANKVLASQTDIVKEKEFWISLLQESPTYLTGWVELAKIHVSLGNTDEAEYAFSNAEKIDPNNEAVNEVKKLIE